MTGPEHHKAAEELLEIAADLYGGGLDAADPATTAMVAATAAVAQVHATLALADLAGLSNTEKALRRMGVLS